MMMRKKRISILTMAITALISVMVGVFGLMNSSNTVKAIDGNWTANVSGNGAGEGNWSNSGNIVFTQNEALNSSWDSIYYRSNPITGNEYTMETVGKTSNNAMNTSVETLWAIVPYFSSWEDHIIIYLAWRTDGTRMFEQIGVKDNYVGVGNGEWTSYWSNQSPIDSIVSNRSYASNQDIKLKVAVSGKDYAIYFQDTYIATYTTKRADAVKGNIGVMAYGDTTTFSSFTIEDGVPSITEGTSELSVFDKTFYVNSDVWTKSGSNLVSTNTAWQSNYALTESGNDRDITVTMRVKGTGVSTHDNGSEIHVVLLPWYVNQTNYISIGLKWDSTATGIADIYMVCGNDPDHFESFDIRNSNTEAKSLKISDGMDIKITKSRSPYSDNNDIYTVYINNEYIFHKGFMQSVNNTSPSYIGLYSGYDTVTFSNFAIAKYEVQDEVGGDVDLGEDDVDLGDTSDDLGDGVDLGADDFVEDVEATGTNKTNDFFKKLVPWGIVVLCVICVIPFLVGIIKKALYKAKK